jgi:hypothetical protein
MADTAIYRIVRTGEVQQLKLLDRTTMVEQRFTEPRELETWLASSGKELFGRDVLWIARQDWAADEQRSDLIGIEKGSGDLVVTELKRGTADEGAITQALGYAAEYAEMDYGKLLAIFRRNSQKLGGLLDTPEQDVEVRLKEAVGDSEAGESHVVLVVAEDFSAKALAVANYLNNNSGSDASYSIELWRFGIRVDKDGDRMYFMLEQILPPFDARDEIEKKRDAAKARRRPRDPVRTEFINRAWDFFNGKGYAVAKHWKQYSFGFRAAKWPEGLEANLSFERWQEAPVLKIPSGLTTVAMLPDNIARKDLPDGGLELTLLDADSKRADFTDDLGKRVLAIFQ